MKKKFLLLLVSSFTGATSFISCKKEKPCEAYEEGNKSPIAVAGSDQVITLPTDRVLLDGSASRDPDGTISSPKKKTPKRIQPIDIQKFT
jgi:hypothetical protein